METVINSTNTWVGMPTYDETLAELLKEVGSLDRLNEVQLRNLATAKTELMRLERTSKLSFYKPHAKQEKFHRDNSKIRLLIGGNRSGKSVAGAIEAIWYATGTHPYHKVRVPSEGWVVSLDFPTSRDVAEEKINEWIPKHLIKKWDNQARIVYLTNGSIIGFKSCDQGVEKFGGRSLDWIWIDEEPIGNNGYQIWQECMIRTVDRAGKIWLTMSPTNGMSSWSYDEIYEMAGIDKDISVIKASMYDNPHIVRGEIEKVKNRLSSEEQKMRLEGEYIQFSGLVYKEFDKNVHVIKGFAIPDDWKKFRSIDHGIANPTACLWVACNNKEELYVYDEYYETDKTIKENCENIKTITAKDKIEWTTIDPSTEARDPQTGVSDRQIYHDNGIYTKTLRVNNMTGINMVRQLLLKNSVTDRPRLFIFDNCYNTIKEISRYRWKSKIGETETNAMEQPIKSLDHALDALRYLVTSRPEYNLDDEYMLDPKPTVKWYAL